MKSQRKNQSKGWIGILGACLLVLVSFSWARNPELSQIREELGDSYSPFAVVNVGDGASPFAETYISNTTGADLVVEVEQAVLAELADLRDVGPSGAELAAALETVRQSLELFSNEQINDEVLDVLTDPVGHPDFDAFLGQAFLVDDLDLTAYLRSWLPADRYIAVTVLPR